MRTPAWMLPGYSSVTVRRSSGELVSGYPKVNTPIATRPSLVDSFVFVFVFIFIPNRSEVAERANQSTGNVWDPERDEPVHPSILP